MRCPDCEKSGTATGSRRNGCETIYTYQCAGNHAFYARRTSHQWSRTSGGMYDWRCSECGVTGSGRNPPEARESVGMGTAY